METMVANDAAQVGHAEYEEERAKYWTLGGALGQGDSGGGAAVDVNELLLVCEVWFEQGGCSAGDAEWWFKAVEENCVVDSFKSGSEVQEDENGEVARVKERRMSSVTFRRAVSVLCWEWKLDWNGSNRSFEHCVVTICFKILDRKGRLEMRVS